MSVAPHAGVVDFGTFTPPTPSLDGIQGEVPQPLIGQENYVLTGNGWSSLGALGALTYQGTWNASTNTPTLVSSVGTQGYYYVVSVAGNTNLNGITTWDVGDWAIFNGSVWQKLEGGSVGTFTNVITPAVTAPTDDLTLYSANSNAININNDVLKVYRNNTITGGLASFTSPAFSLIPPQNSYGASIANLGLNPRVTTNGTDGIYLQTNSSTGYAGSTQTKIVHIASAVNYIQAQGASTGNQPFLWVGGSDTNIALGISSKGNGNLNLFTNGGGNLQFQVAHRASADVYLTAQGGVGGVSRPSFGAALAGASAAGFNIYNSGGQPLRFQTSGNGVDEQFIVAHTISTVNAAQITGAATGSSPTLSMQGSDSVIAFGVRAKGNGDIFFQNNGSLGTSLVLSGVSSGVNYYQLTNAATTYAPTFKAVGADTNISAAILSKGTGAIDLAAGSSGVNISNGGTITGITRSGTGTGYSSAPTVTIAPPTTAGGVQATAQVSGYGSTAGVIVSGGTGYTLNDVITVNAAGSGGTYTVTGVTGGVVTAVTTTGNGGTYTSIPTNPVATTGGTGTGLTLNLSNFYVVNFSILTAGSGYVEQPTVTVSGGGGSGASAYVTVGSPTIIRSLGGLGNSAQSLSLHTSSGETLRLATGTSQATNGTPVANFFQIAPGASGNGPAFSAIGTDTNIWALISSKGTGSVALQTNSGFTQALVSNTTSAVNYLQFTGGATGNTPILSAQGSDATIGLRLQSKGTSFLYLQNNLGTTQFSAGGTSSAVNYLNARGNATGSGAALEASGTDTNIAMQMVTKGTGAFDIVAGTSGVNISNGTTVTGITITNGGSGYTTVPAPTISAPTSSGGVQAVGQTRVGLWGTTITSGGTGYTVGDVLTFVGGTPYLAVPATQLQVTTVSAGVITGVTVYNQQYGTYTTTPTNPISVTGGTGTGATITATWTVYGIAVTTAGSGYVEQPTVTLAAPPSGTTATATARVGGTVIQKALSTSFDLYTSNGTALRLTDNTNAVVNYWQLSSSATNTQVGMIAVGADTNIGTNFSTKGTSGHVFSTNSYGAVQAVFAHTASAVNYLQSTGGATGNPPVISAQGSDTNISPEFRSKGTGSLIFSNSSGQWGFYVTPVASTANQIKVVSAVAGGTPFFQSTGSDTNISLNLVTKGTGTVQQNGNPLAQVNHKYHAFTVGSYYYDSYEQNNYFRLFSQNAAADTIRYGAVNTPEYYDYGTSTWTAWAAGTTGIQNLLDGNPNTGMDVAHANRTFRFVVTNSDGWPTNALVMLQTTWSAVTYTTATVTIASGTAVGGPFTTRQVMVFSSANTGNNWGLHAYYTGSIHTGEGFYQITIDLTNWVDSGLYTTYPLRNLNIFSNYSTVAGRILPFSNSYDKRSTFIGGISTADDVTGSLYVGRYSSADPSTYIDSGSSATRMNLRTQYTTQLQLFHTASAVNYVQVTGGATGNGAVISAAGSDTNINTFIASKGASSIVMSTNGKEGFRVADGGASVVNNIQVVGTNTGSAPYFVSRGSDANIGLSLNSKGTGDIALAAGTGGWIDFRPGGVRSGQVEYVASAVNYLNLRPAITGSAATIAAVGSDTNIDISFVPKGTGGVAINSAIKLGAGASAGTSGQVLTSAGAGASPTWSSVSGSGGMTTLGTITFSGTNQQFSLTGLTLTSYKQLYIVMNGINAGVTGNTNLSISGLTGDQSATYWSAQMGQTAQQNWIYGAFFVDLVTGITIGGQSYARATASTSMPLTSTTGIPNANAAPITAISNSSTAVYAYFTATTGTRSGTLTVYGIA